MIAAALAVVVVMTGGWFVYRARAAAGCGGRTVRLAIAAAPEIAPALQAAAKAWATPQRRVNGLCPVVTVTAADSADVTAAIADQNQVSLGGVGRADGKTAIPEAWVPDSSMWLQRLRAASPGFVPGESVSIGSSPIVLALPEPAAVALQAGGGGTGKITWDALLAKVTSDNKLRLGIVEPARDATGLSSMLALSSAAAAVGANAQEATVAVLRALATGRAQLRDELLRRFPRAADPASLSAGLSMAPLSEQAVISFNAGRPPVPLAALYVDPPPAPLDYPFTFMPNLDQQKRTVATALRTALAANSFRDRLGSVGLRAPNGSHGKGFTAGRTAPVTAPSPLQMPDVASIDRALSTWSTVTAQARMLAVIDVSGSMQTPVATAGGATREQLTVAAARRGMGLFDDSWALGLWTFATNLDGPKDYRELATVGPLSAQRDQLGQALNQVVAQPNGNTGLYDTALAAYQTMQAGWDAGRVNSVVIFTDGENHDDAGITLDQLIAALKNAVDPRRPVQMIFIGIGSQVGEAAMRRIADTTGGGVFIADDPAKIGEIFLKAIALRPGSPIK